MSFGITAFAALMNRAHEPRGTILIARCVGVISPGTTSNLQITRRQDPHPLPWGSTMICGQCTSCVISSRCPYMGYAIREMQRPSIGTLLYTTMYHCPSIHHKEGLKKVVMITIKNIAHKIVTIKKNNNDNNSQGQINLNLFSTQTEEHISKKAS